MTGFRAPRISAAAVRLGNKGAFRGPLPEEVIESLAPAVGGETFRGNDAGFDTRCEMLAGDQRAVPGVIGRDHGRTSIIRAPSLATVNS